MAATAAAVVVVVRWSSHMFIRTLVGAGGKAVVVVVGWLGNAARGSTN